MGRHVDLRNQPAEEVLRQAVYLRSSLGRKASLQVRALLGCSVCCGLRGDGCSVRGDAAGRDQGVSAEQAWRAAGEPSVRQRLPHAAD